LTRFEIIENVFRSYWFFFKIKKKIVRIFQKNAVRSTGHGHYDGTIATQNCCISNMKLTTEYFTESITWPRKKPRCDFSWNFMHKKSIYVSTTYWNFVSFPSKLSDLKEIENSRGSKKGFRTLLLGSLLVWCKMSKNML